MYWKETVVYGIKALAFLVMLAYFAWMIWELAVIKEAENGDIADSECTHDWEIIWLDDEGGTLSCCKKCRQEEFN